MNIIHQYKEDFLKISIVGDLGHHEAREIISKMETIITLYTVGAVRLDLSQMTFMDSSGLAVVLHLHRSLKGVGRKLTVKGTNPQAMRVFQAAGLPKMICFEEEE